MQHFQPLAPVQRLRQRAHDLEMAQGVLDDAGEPRPRRLDILRLDGEYKVLRLYKAVVPVFKLPAEHFRVKGADAVKVVALGADLDPLHEILPVHAPAGEGELHADGRVMGVIHVAQRLKDGGLVLLPGDLVVHVLKLDTAGPCRVLQSAEAVRVHLAEREGVLGGVRFPVPLGLPDDPPDLPFFGGGQLMLWLFGRLRLPLWISGQSFAPPSPS